MTRREGRGYGLLFDAKLLSAIQRNSSFSAFMRWFSSI